MCVCVCGYTDREMTLNGIGAEFKAGRAYVYLDVVCMYILGQKPFQLQRTTHMRPPPLIHFC